MSLHDLAKHARDAAYALAALAAARCHVTRAEDASVGALDDVTCARDAAACALEAMEWPDNADALPVWPLCGDTPRASARIIRVAASNEDGDDMANALRRWADEVTALAEESEAA